MVFQRAFTLYTHQYQITKYDLTKKVNIKTQEIEFIAVGRMQDQVKKLNFCRYGLQKILQTVKG